MKTKVCKKCGKQPLSKFYKSKKGHYRCKQCARDYSRTYSKTHWQKILAYQRSPARKKHHYKSRMKYKLRNRWFVRDYLSTHHCVDCGESRWQVLEFDHVRGRKLHNISHIVNQGMNTGRLKAEIAKCDVRCVLCHRLKTAKQLAWYE